MSSSVTVAILCHASEPDVAATLECVIDGCLALDNRRAEIVLVVNGAVQVPSTPLLSARDLCLAKGIVTRVEGVEAVADSEMPGQLVARLVESCRSGKAWAWNRAWEKARGEIVVFSDADLRIAPQAISRLCSALEQSPELAAVSATPVPVLPAEYSFTARASAFRYQFDLHNLFGGLYALRSSASVYPIPENVLSEDAWLTARIGTHQIGREPWAKVRFVAAGNLQDYFWERVRTEAGKLQLRRLLRNGAKAARSTYPWKEFFRCSSAGDYLLAGFSLVVRMVARCWARVELRRGGPERLWRSLPSTKVFPDAKSWLASAGSRGRRPGDTSG